MDRLSGQSALAPRVDDQPRGAAPLISDEDLARLTNVNLLIMGADDVVTRFVISLWPCFLTPWAARRRGEPLRLMRPSRPVGTILIHEVQTLTPREQQALYHWINAGHGRTRIVSTTSQSLLPLIETGAFNDRLYYRLNVLTFDLRSPAAS